MRLLLNWDVWYGSSLSQLQNSSCTGVFVLLIYAGGKGEGGESGRS